MAIHPVHDDLDRAQLIKETEIAITDSNALRDALIDADARLREFVQVCDATLAIFNADAEGEADTIKRYEDIPVWVKDMMGLLAEGGGGSVHAEGGDVHTDVRAAWEKEVADWKAQNAANVELSNKHLAEAQLLAERVQLAVAEAQRWEKERESALQAARTHREAADAAVKELRSAQKEADEARKSCDVMVKELFALKSARDADMDAAVTVAGAFEAMVADTAAVLDLTACGPETQEAVARAMAIIEPAA